MRRGLQLAHFPDFPCWPIIFTKTGICRAQRYTCPLSVIQYFSTALNNYRVICVYVGLSTDFCEQRLSKNVLGGPFRSGIGWWKTIRFEPYIDLPPSLSTISQALVHRFCSVYVCVVLFFNFIYSTERTVRRVFNNNDIMVLSL